MRWRSPAQSSTQPRMYLGPWPSFPHQSKYPKLTVYLHCPWLLATNALHRHAFDYVISFQNCYWNKLMRVRILFLKKNVYFIHGKSEWQRSGFMFMFNIIRPEGKNKIYIQTKIIYPQNDCTFTGKDFQKCTHVKDCKSFFQLVNIKQ